MSGKIRIYKDESWFFVCPAHPLSVECRILDRYEGSSMGSWDAAWYWAQHHLRDYHGVML